MLVKNNLKIWLIREGEGLPIVQGDRCMRMGMLAEYLVKQGHEVTWWSSTFHHGKKKYIEDGYKEYSLKSNETLILLHSNVVYKKNVSLERIRYHEILAKEFKKHSEKKEKPDIIVCSWPTIPFSKAAVEYGEKNNVPVILDARDMWPDIFSRGLPSWMQWAAEVALYPMKRSAARIFSKATGIVAVSPFSLEWACNYAGRKPGNNDRTIFIGSNRVETEREAVEERIKDWKNKGITDTSWNMCFIGTLSANSLDLETVIRAVKQLSKTYPDIKLLIGGNGDAFEQLKVVVDDCDNIVFLGWLDKVGMESLLKISKCGAYCYKNLLDFKNGFGNKIVQYMAGKLAILNSTQGFAKDYLAECNLGLTYQEGNVEDCMQQITRLYEDEKARRIMAQNAYLKFEEQFEESIVNKHYEDYICEIYEKYKGVLNGN